MSNNAGARAYFRDIHLTLKTILIGMRVTLKYCFGKTITVQYPDVAPVLQPRFRGFHVLRIDQCLVCEACARACPVDCIYIEKTGPRRIDKEVGAARGGAVLRWAVDYSKCMFCGLCVEPCPTKCIEMGNIHDLSGYTRESMIVEFTDLARAGLQTPLPLWMQKEKLPAWAERTKREWIERGRQAHKEMLNSLIETAITKKKPAEQEKAAAGQAKPATSPGAAEEAK